MYWDSYSRNEAGNLPIVRLVCNTYNRIALHLYESSLSGIRIHVRSSVLKRHQLNTSKYKTINFTVQNPLGDWSMWNIIKFETINLKEVGLNSMTWKKILPNMPSLVNQVWFYIGR